MPQQSSNKIICPTCHFAFGLQQLPPDQPPRFCVLCGTALDRSITSDTVSETSTPYTIATSPALIKGHAPEDENIQFTLGPYQAFRNIGKGGMGEVYLAYDSDCGRRIALKRIRSDLMEHVQMHNRFLKEARITCQLTHPSIIPIYAIHGEGNLIYYTMPYVEGKTLKQILRDTRSKERKGEKIDHAQGSIPYLIRIYLNICQAIAYAHSKGVLHRDIKPENIIIGNYGEVQILDWGLAKIIKKSKQSHYEEDDLPIENEPNSLHGITNLGKVVGTVAYMAPERAIGHPATKQTDVYSLGVILYQILTLRYPFRRGTLKEFRKNIKNEVLQPPAEIAPYRDVPPMLAQIAVRALSNDLSHRYESVEQIIHDVENYLEGRSEWFEVAELDFQNKDDWEFQENVLIAEHVAITRGTEISDWVNLMISKLSFPENTKVEASVRIGEKGHGIGFLLSIPESDERTHLNDGYCLWIGSDLNRTTKLLRSTVEVVHSPDIILQRNEWYRIRIEKIENNIHFYLNDILQFSFISHIPLAGTHMGILSRDADFTMSHIKIFAGSQNLTTSCLAIPDAFLAHKNYQAALSEYRRIGYSFPGRAEGREALFRAGITLLEQGRDSKEPQESLDYFEQALNEFEKLHKTAGAPLEYLGKALVYQTMRDYEEEIKCFELAYRRYPKHPLLPILQEQIVYRMHESSRYHRQATYSFILLTLRHLPNVTETPITKKLFASLERHWEPLYFIEEDPYCLQSEELKKHFFAIQLGFWLAKPYMIAEVIDDLANIPHSAITIGNALFSLLELGSWGLARQKLEEISADIKDNENLAQVLKLIDIGIICHEFSPKEALQEFLEYPFDKLTKQEERIALHIMEVALLHNETSTVHIITDFLKKHELSSLGQLYLSSQQIWAYLQEKKWDKAAALLQVYPLELLTQETTPLHFLYGCVLYHNEGKEIANIHFHGVLDISYPRTWALFSYYYNGKIKEGTGWFNKAFLWEKRQIYKQLALFYACTDEQEKSEYYLQQAKHQFTHPNL